LEYLKNGLLSDSHFMQGLLKFKKTQTQTNAKKKEKYRL
jgi:hypothetical protein